MPFWARFGMFFDKRNCSFRLLSGLVVSSLSAKRRGRFRRQNGRQRENHSGIVAVKRSPPGRVILESYFENCRILALQFRLGAIRRRMGTNAALLNSKARPADRGCPKFQTFGGTTFRAPISNAPSAFGRARPIEDGVRLFVEWFREFHKLGY
jgi:hypothetical protein